MGHRVIVFCDLCQQAKLGSELEKVAIGVRSFDFCAKCAPKYTVKDLVDRLGLLSQPASE